MSVTGLEQSRKDEKERKEKKGLTLIKTWAAIPMESRRNFGFCSGEVDFLLFFLFKGPFTDYKNSTYILLCGRYIGHYPTKHEDEKILSCQEWQ